MDEEEAAVAVAQIEAQADVAQAAIEADAQVASVATAEAGETERANTLAHAFELRDADSARITALESQLGELRLSLESLAGGMAQVAQVAMEAEGTAQVALEVADEAASPEGDIPELDTPSEEAPAAEPEPPAGDERRRKTRLQQRRERRL